MRYDVWCMIHIYTSYISSWPNLAVSSWPPCLCQPCQELIQTQLGPFVVPSKVQVEEEDFDFEQEESGSQRDWDHWEVNRCGSFEVPYHGFFHHLKIPEVCLYLKMDRPEMGHSSGRTWSSSTTSSFESTARGILIGGMLQMATFTWRTAETAETDDDRWHLSMWVGNWKCWVNIPNDS